MSYTKQNFTDGQILKAEHLNHIEDGIYRLGEETFVDGAKAKREMLLCDALDKATKTSGRFFNGNSWSTVEADGWNYYTLPVTPGLKCRVSTYCVSNAYAVAIHNEDGGFVARYPEAPNGVVDITFEIPNGASYIIVNELSSEPLILELESEVYGFSSALRNATIDNYVKDAGFISVKDKAKKVENRFLTRSLSYTSINGWNTYELAVTSGETYKIKTYYVSAAVMYAFGYADGNVSVYPTSEPPSGIVEEIELTIPNNVVKIVINENAGESAVIEKKDSSVVRFRNLSDYLYGKKLVACGDSITEAINPNGGNFDNYARIVAKRHGMSCHVDGIGGTTMTNIGDGRAFSESRYLQVPDFDYLTLWFGWNDGAYAELGTINDTGNTTFYGGYKTVLEHLITNNPTKKIGLIVPYGSEGLKPIAQAVRELSQMYGVPCLDLWDYNKCSLLWGAANDAQLARRDALTYDTTHPNQAGHEYLSTMYEQFLLSL